MSEASLNAKLHKGAQSRLKAEIDSLKKWREDHYPKVRTFMHCVTLVKGPEMCRVKSKLNSENVWWAERRGKI